MTGAADIERWISQDGQRMAALEAARHLALPDWCLAAGFVRNLVWDRCPLPPLSVC